MIVVDSSLSSDEYHQLLARVSRVSDGAAIHSYVENVAKVITASLSPYALEMVRNSAKKTPQWSPVALHVYLRISWATRTYSNRHTCLLPLSTNLVFILRVSSLPIVMVNNVLISFLLHYRN